MMKTTKMTMMRKKMTLLKIQILQMMTGKKQNLLKKKNLMDQQNGNAS